MTTGVETSGDVMTTPELIALLMGLRLANRIGGCHINIGKLSATGDEKFVFHSVAETITKLRIYAPGQRFRVHSHRTENLNPYNTIDITTLGQP